MANIKIKRYKVSTLSNAEWFRTAACLVASAITTLVAFGANAEARPLTIDDVLATVQIDRADIAPGSEEIAISVQRPALPGEVYGRNAYEIDSSRNDIWIVSRDGTTIRNLTNGQSRAAGFWCPYWSPDGRYLAMLSTNFEGEEQRGGDNVHLYVWDRESGTIRRVSQRAIVTQTRYGSPLNELDLRAKDAREPNSCRAGDENAPFLWLDDRRLLAVMMPPGERSAMVDRYAKFHREAARAGAQVRAGEVASVSSSSSGAAVTNEDADAYFAELMVIDLAAQSTESLGQVHAFPMFGALTIALSPNGKQAAILAPRRAIEPHRRSPVLPIIPAWSVEKRLGIVTLDEPASLRWVEVPAEARYPVDLLAWAPDGKALAFRARGDPARLSGDMWTVYPASGEVRPVAPGMRFDSSSPAHQSGAPYAFWLDARRLLLYGQDGDAEPRWQIASDDGEAPTPFASGFEQASDIRATPDGSLVASSDEGPIRFNPDTDRFERLELRRSLGECENWSALVSEPAGDEVRHSRRSSAETVSPELALPARARILDHDCTGIVWELKNFEGNRVHFTAWNTPARHAGLMRRNDHLAAIDWGERRMIAYTDGRGRSQEMAVLFPPDYDPDRAYPTLLWVYAGYEPRSVDNYFFDPHMPGVYNLQVYASHGYVVAVPSIPIPRGDEPREAMQHITSGVIPALDRLIELGITDGERTGVFGQSYGGYTTFALVAQSDRFSAAAALAGLTNLATDYGSFDPTARGYPGIEQDMSANSNIYESVQDFRTDPAVAPQLYARNSPLTYAANIDTPLLIIHGELDIRAGLNQPEALYSLLRRRGRTARLLRYWGENHSLANSPANVRDMSRELLDWFDRFIKADGNSER